MKSTDIFKPFRKEQLDELVSRRPGETKLGETIKIPEGDIISSVDVFAGEIVIIGVPEDIGPRANWGRGGSNGAWTAFLSKFLNTQDNDYLSGESILLLGNVRVEDLLQRSQDTRPDDLRPIVEELDGRVAEIIEMVTSKGKIPVVIGGGHNNCFPILLGASNGFDTSLNCVNLDPHADFRSLEGRHSGNGFTYAKESGVLDRYAIVGLHEAYNPRSMMERLDEDMSIWYGTFDDHLRGEQSLDQQFDKAITHCSAQKTGIELDLDAIEYMPTSAITPSGVTSTVARKYIIQMARSLDVAYLHLTEGAPQHGPGGQTTVGKFLAYTVGDFIKTVQSK